MLSLIPHPQSTEYECGPCSFWMLLSHWGPPRVTIKALDTALETDEKVGTEWHKMVDLAKKLGFIVRAKEGGTVQEMKQQLDKGRPVVVLWWEDVGHYSPVVDVRNGEVHVANPWGGQVESYPNFEKLWYSDVSEKWWMSIEKPANVDAGKITDQRLK